MFLEVLKRIECVLQTFRYCTYDEANNYVISNLAVAHSYCREMIEMYLRRVNLYVL